MPGVDWLLKKYPEKLPAPPCLGEALRRGTFPSSENFTLFYELEFELWSMLSSPNQNNS
jgi:hypothetical protein